jgi:CspA family cold shock protein
MSADKAHRRITGVCKWFSTSKGYGFIIRDDNNCEVFAHHSHLNANHFSPDKPLRSGEPVHFDVMVDNTRNRVFAFDVCSLTPLASPAPSPALCMAHSPPPPPARTAVFVSFQPQTLCWIQTPQGVIPAWLLQHSVVPVAAPLSSPVLAPATQPSFSPHSDPRRCAFMNCLNST